MPRRSGAAVLLCWIALGTGCKQEPGSGQKIEPVASSLPAGPVPSFQQTIAPQLEQTCASARGCHGAEPVDWIDMDLRQPNAYASLVNHAADSRDAVRVKPGEPAQSFLLDKLLGTLGRREGARMPLDPRTRRTMVPSPLEGDFIERTLKPWIAAGAPNN